ncbi:MAG: hypothetical protein V4733_12925 [Verrucomicrobiota bacterium]
MRVVPRARSSGVGARTAGFATSLLAAEGSLGSEGVGSASHHAPADEGGVMNAVAPHGITVTLSKVAVWVTVVLRLVTAKPTST